MIKNIVRGHDNELIFRIKQLHTGKVVDLDSDLGYPLTGVRIFLYNKFRQVQLKYAVDIVNSAWSNVTGFNQIYPEKKDKGIVSIKVSRADIKDMSAGPYYVRSILIFERSGFPSGLEYRSVPNELFYAGQVVGENEFDNQESETTFSGGYETE